MSDYTALAGRLRTSLQDVKASVDRALLLSEKAHKSGDDGYWDGVALNLHGFYTHPKNFRVAAIFPFSTFPFSSQ